MILLFIFQPSGHSRILELLQQASTRVLFIYLKHLISFEKQQESSQLDEIAGSEINVNDYGPSFNKKKLLLVNVFSFVFSQALS